MAPFRWPETKHDIALATEVAARRPQRPQDWDGIAATLSQHFSTRIEFSTRIKLTLLARVVKTG